MAGEHFQQALHTPCQLWCLPNDFFFDGNLGMSKHQLVYNLLILLEQISVILNRMQSYRDSFVLVLQR